MESRNFIYSLSYKNVNEIPFDKYERNFTFIVNGKAYETSRIVADLLSPKVRRFHYIDDTISEISINTKIKDKKEDSKNSIANDYFSDFLNLSQFKQNNIDLLHLKHYCEYFILLGNVDEYIHLQSAYSDRLTIDNAIDSLLSLTELIKVCNEPSAAIVCNESIKKIISFAASNFDQLDKEKLKKLEISVLEEIISSDSLKLEEEDTLLQLLIELYENDINYSYLFEYVIFSNVKKETIKLFIETFDIEFLNLGIWKSISKRLLSSKIQRNDIDQRYYEQINTFEHVKGKEFEGIMRYLTKQTGGNIHDNETIEITSNSILNNDYRYHPKNLVDYENDTLYNSDNDENVNITFDFKDKRIQLSAYSIQSVPDGPGAGNLKNWVVEVSNDKDKWIIVDEHQNDSSLNESDIIATFNTKQDMNEYYRFIRIRQTGISWFCLGNDYNLYFPFVEFYGKLKQPKKNKF